MLRSKILTGLSAIIIFYLFLFPSIDPDLGWHLKYGQFIWQNHKLLSTDIFSWSMSGFAWSSISWIFDGFVYLIFNKFSFFALSLLSTLVLCFTYYLLIKPLKLFPPTLLLAIFSLHFFITPMVEPGLRVQLFPLLFTGLFLFITAEIEKGQMRKGYFLPLLMLLWVNFHGTFIIGLFLTTAFVIYRMTKKNFGFWVLILFMSLTTVFLNPQGVNILRQIVEYAPTQRIQGIIEWMPVPPNSEAYLGLVIWTIIIAICLLRNRKSPFALYQAITSLGLSYLAFGSRRMIGPYFIFSFPLVFNYLNNLKFNEKPGAKLLVNIIFLALFINMVFNLPSKIKNLNISWFTYCEINKKCSFDAAKYLQKNPLPEKSFTHYNFGGFTIWQNPKSKVFVDGRMDQWSKNGYSPFVDHQKIINEDDLELFNKYNFQAVYIPPTLRLYFYLKRQTAQGKWRLDFEDDKAAIFTRVKK